MARAQSLPASACTSLSSMERAAPRSHGRDKMEQARITHAESVRMVEASPLLRRDIGIRRDGFNPKPGRADKFLPLGRDSKSLDGLNPHGAILDEVPRTQTARSTTSSNPARARAVSR